MKVIAEVYIQCEFEGFHRWDDAPQEVAFLRDRHRHVFHVRAAWRVDDLDREIEFILQKRIVLKQIAEKQSQDRTTERWSCEQWASWLLWKLSCVSVNVSEDGENGATVYMQKE